jgi:hypothetical protein
MKNWLDIVNDPLAGVPERLAALGELKKTVISVRNSGGPQKNGEINNHIHTMYSFSPYTPSMAAYRAWAAGLEAAGSVDHDSAAAAEEMLAACGILGIGGCVGFEVRVSFKTGPDGKESFFAGRKINNPDSPGLAYMTVQGIPAPALKRVGKFLDPIRQERRLRTREMCSAANTLLLGAGFGEIDFDKDIIGASRFEQGGEITERHLLQAAAHRFIEVLGKGPAIPKKLTSLFGITVPAALSQNLSDAENPHYLYDLLGVLKSGFLGRIFIQPGEKECPPASTVTAFASSIGAIPAYAYLGDIKESPTGDKKAEKFEDDYIETLFDELARLGYRALTYMPPRNTREQLRRVQRLCAERGFMEISGVDINSSRQSFNCPQVLEPDFCHLIDTTWALIAHERLASYDGNLGLFSPRSPLASRSLPERIAAYAVAGKALNPEDTESSAPLIAEKMRKGV